MIKTNYRKKAFGDKAYWESGTGHSRSTKGYTVRKSETIKIIQKREDESTFSGYRRVNYAEQKMQEVYRKYNNMLGGNECLWGTKKMDTQ